MAWPETDMGENKGMKIREKHVNKCAFFSQTDDNGMLHAIRTKPLIGDRCHIEYSLSVACVNVNGGGKPAFWR